MCQVSLQVRAVVGVPRYTILPVLMSFRGKLTVIHEQPTGVEERRFWPKYEALRTKDLMGFRLLLCIFTSPNSFRILRGWWPPPRLSSSLFPTNAGGGVKLVNPVLRTGVSQERLAITKASLDYPHTTILTNSNNMPRVAWNSSLDKVGMYSAASLSTSWTPSRRLKTTTL